MDGVTIAPAGERLLRCSLERLDAVERLLLRPAMPQSQQLEACFEQARAAMHELESYLRANAQSLGAMRSEDRAMLLGRLREYRRRLARVGVLAEHIGEYCADWLKEVRARAGYTPQGGLNQVPLPACGVDEMG